MNFFDSGVNASYVNCFKNTKKQNELNLVKLLLLKIYCNLHQMKLMNSVEPNRRIA